MSKSKPTKDDVQHFYATIECEQIDEDHWRATEPDGVQDVVGEGENPRAAAIDYIERLD